MTKHHFRVAVRQLRQRPVFSIILIVGLTIGLAAALLVSTVVVNDLSYDRQWTKKDRIYRILSTDLPTGERSSITFEALPPELKQAMPEVEDYCRMVNTDLQLKIGNEEQGVHFSALQAERSVFDFLDLQVLEGNPKTLIAGVNNLVITETVRKRFFPGENPVGRRLTNISAYNTTDTFVISGVVRDLPQNTHLRAEVIVVGQFDRSRDQPNGPGWKTLMTGYLLVRPNTDIKGLELKTNAWYNREIDPKDKRQTSFQPITDVYLHSDFGGYQPVKGNIRTVYILGCTAGLLLLIACINYVNLATAAAIKRMKATGIRKILGASRKELFRQFLVESFVYFLTSFLIASALFFVSLPPLESFIGSPLPLSVGRQWSVSGISCATILVLTILTALYPALLLSKPKAVVAFGFSGTTGKGRERFRRSLVILQFAISIVLLITTIVVHRQVKLFDEAPLGYNKNNLIVIDWYAWDENSSKFRNELNRISGVQSVCISKWLPGGGSGSMTSEMDDPAHPGKKVVVATISADVNFSQTLGVHLLHGRWLNDTYGRDAPNFDSLMSHDLEALGNVEKYQSELVTETVAKRLGIKQLGVPVQGMSGIPVGIIADFKNESLKAPQGLCVVQAESKSTYGGMLIRVSPGTLTQIKPQVAILFHKYYPSQVLKMNEATDLLAAQYAAEKKLMKVFYFFSGLIVFLSCMGLFGLVTFMVQSRVKEIGIRKVLGASTTRITAMFTWNFLRLVLLSALMAVPAGAWLMNRWLQDYPYRTGLRWWLFFVPVASTAMVAALTVGIQSVRAAIANPADALRTE